jgi:hypothetical protein
MEYLCFERGGGERQEPLVVWLVCDVRVPNKRIVERGRVEKLGVAGVICIRAAAGRGAWAGNEGK